MHRKLTLLLALAAGLVGGLLSRYLAPPPVSAQTMPLKELRAQSFVLVDDQNNIIGTFKTAPGMMSSASPHIVLLERSNKEIWRAGIFGKVLGAK
jgi:hypothetical protein